MNAHKEYMEWRDRTLDGSEAGVANCAAPGIEGAFKAGLNRGWKIHQDESWVKFTRDLGETFHRLETAIRILRGSR